jgi:hypothetical protein
MELKMEELFELAAKLKLLKLLIQRDKTFSHLPADLDAQKLCVRKDRISCGPSHQQILAIQQNQRSRS